MSAARAALAAAAIVLAATIAWMLTRPLPEWTDVYRASVMHVDPLPLPDAGITQSVPGSQRASSLGVPYRLPGGSPARVEVAVTADGRPVADRVLTIAPTGLQDSGRLLRPAGPWGADTGLLEVDFPPAPADLRLTIRPLAGPRPVLLEAGTDHTSLPAADGMPGESLSVLVGVGERRPAAARLPVYLERMAAVGAPWTPAPVLGLLGLLLLTLPAVMLIDVARRERAA